MKGYKECKPERMNIQRLFARAFVIAGGLFWMTAAFAGHYAFKDSGLAVAAGNAVYPLAATLATLVVGWIYERLAAVLLFAGSAGVVVWGVLFGWEPLVWLVMTTVLIGPMLIAGVLFYLAGRMQYVCSLSETYAAERLARNGSRA